DNHHKKTNPEDQGSHSWDCIRPVWAESWVRLDSMANDVPITPEGLEAVRREHEELTTRRRPSIVPKIKAARELGDLSENFEYHAAKNEQGMMEARVKELESIIK